jgi:hypothetical protein
MKKRIIDDTKWQHIPTAKGSIKRRRKPCRRNGFFGVAMPRHLTPKAKQQQFDSHFPVSSLTMLAKMYMAIY